MFREDGSLLYSLPKQIKRGGSEGRASRPPFGQKETDSGALPASTPRPQEGFTDCLPVATRRLTIVLPQAGKTLPNLSHLICL